MSWPGTQRMPEIVFDCCVLSNFAVSHSLPVIKRMYGNSAVVTDFVVAEIRRGFQAGHEYLRLVQDALAEGWLEEASLRRKQERGIFRSCCTPCITAYELHKTLLFQYLGEYDT